MMTVLSLDISASCTGWSLLIDDKIEHGKIKTKATLTTAQRLHIFRGELARVMQIYKPKIVIIEDTFVGANPSVVKLLAKFAGVAEQLVFEQFKLPPVIISNKSVKAFFKVKDKKELFNVVVDILDWDSKSSSYKDFNDVIDSCAQLLYYYNEVLKTKVFREELDYGYKFKFNS